MLMFTTNRRIRRLELAWLMEVSKCQVKKQLGLVTKVIGKALIVMMDDY